MKPDLCAENGTDQADTQKDSRRGCRLREGGRLEDIAPTLLQLLGLPQPEAMTGKTLIEE